MFKLVVKKFTQTSIFLFLSLCSVAAYSQILNPITGFVTVAEETIFAGDAQSCTYTLDNGGRLPTDVRFQAELTYSLDPSFSQLIDRTETIQGAARFQFIDNLNTAGLAPGEYTCTLSAFIRDEESPVPVLTFLDSGTFTVEEDPVPPVSIDLTAEALKNAA